MVISIGNRVLKANDPNSLSKFGGGITLTDNWARGLFWNPWTRLNEKEPQENKVSVQFLAEEKFTFQRAISTVVYNQEIPAEFVINLDQTTLFIRIPEKYTFNLKGAKNVPIKDVDHKRQITVIHLRSVQPMNFYNCN